MAMKKRKVNLDLRSKEIIKIMKKITTSQLQLLAPNIRKVYATAFQTADALLADYKINENGLRLSHFMAQILHESGAFTILEENLNYSAKRMTQVWPSRFPTVASAEPFAHNPQKLANKVYNGRMGNANGSNDGWRYIGRGLMQITGRDSYTRFGKKLGIDLVGNPELAYASSSCLKIAAEEWAEKGCNALADADKIVSITIKINGGKIGLAE